MCLIIYAPQGARISSDWISEGWKTNDDGAGYMFASGGVLHVRKPFFTLDDLLTAYDADFAAHGAESQFVMHLRWTTHGMNDARNTHPHILDNGRAAMVHNGILSAFDGGPRDISDTVFFCSTVLAARSAEQLLEASFQNMLAEMIGPGNKFAMMDCLGNVTLVNQEAGLWDGEFWLSNNSYKAAPITKWNAVASDNDTIVRGYAFPDKLPVKYQDKATDVRQSDADRDLWGDELDDRRDYFRDTSSEYLEAMAELERLLSPDLLNLTSHDLYCIASVAEQAGDALEEYDYGYADVDDYENDEAAAWLRERQRVNNTL